MSTVRWCHIQESPQELSNVVSNLPCSDRTKRIRNSRSFASFRRQRRAYNMKIPVQPIHGASPLMCAENVKKRIRACGGEAVYGWLVKEEAYSYIWSSHVVWKDESGKLWDVTPDFTGELLDQFHAFV